MLSLKNQIILGNVTDVLPTFPDKCIDLVVTSPPYDNLRTYEDNAEFNWDVFCKTVFELYRIVKNGGVVVWIVGDETKSFNESGSSFKQALHFKEQGFNLYDTMIFQKKGISFPAYRKYTQSFEYMFIFTIGKPNTVNLIKDVPNTYAGDKLTGSFRSRDGVLNKHSGVAMGRIIKDVSVRGNIWPYSVGCHKSTRDLKVFNHPATFPEKLAHDHIITWSNPSDIVLDPFAGSGTTLKESMLTGRYYVGIEMVPKYYDLAQQRLSEHIDFTGGQHGIKGNKCTLKSI